MSKKRNPKKALKDLDPKGRARNVKGGRTTLATQVSRINRSVGRTVEHVGDAINATGGTFNRTMGQVNKALNDPR